MLNYHNDFQSEKIRNYAHEQFSMEKVASAFNSVIEKVFIDNKQ
jgi:hypothetical protein